MDGSSIETITISGLNAPRGLVVDAQAQVMYWADWGTVEIFKANLDGSNAQKIVEQSEFIFPRGVDYSPTTNQVFWSDFSLDKVFAVNLDDGVIDSIATRATGLGSSSGFPRVHGIAVDPRDQKVYWTSPNGDVINYVLQRSNLDGSNIEDVLTREDGFQSGWDLELDLSARYIYWTYSNRGGIYRAGMDGGPIEPIETESGALISGIAVDSIGKKLYWTQELNSESQIMRTNLEGSEREEVIAEGLTDPAGIAIDIDEQKMYWADWKRSLIQRANLDGTEIEEVMSVYKPLWIALGSPPSKRTTETPDETSTLSISSYPNPFSRSTLIEYSLETEGRTRVVIYDVLGREVTRLVDAWQSTGTYQFEWDSENLPGGMYLIRIFSGDAVEAVHPIIKSE